MNWKVFLGVLYAVIGVLDLFLAVGFVSDGSNVKATLYFALSAVWFSLAAVWIGNAKD